MSNKLCEKAWFYDEGNGNQISKILGPDVSYQKV